jgi:hypothetical protein
VGHPWVLDPTDVGVSVIFHPWIAPTSDLHKILSTTKFSFNPAHYWIAGGNNPSLHRSIPILHAQHRRNSASQLETAWGGALTRWRLICRTPALARRSAAPLPTHAVLLQLLLQNREQTMGEGDQRWHSAPASPACPLHTTRARVRFLDILRHILIPKIIKQIML